MGSNKMGRRKQSTIVDAVIVASYLPLWCCILMAITSYFVLNNMANLQNKPVTVMYNLGNSNAMFNLGHIALSKIIITLSLFGKYIVPFTFSVGAIISFINKTKRKRLYSSVVNRVPVEKNNYVGSIVSAFNKIKRNPIDYSDVNIVPLEKNNYSNSQYDPIKNMSWQNFEMLVSVFFKEQV